MRSTGPRDLVVPFVVVAVAVYLALRISYDSLPPLRFFVPVPVAALAVVEAVAARRVSAVVRHVPDAKPMTAIAVARCVALGKASSLVAAGLGGAAVALLVRVLPDVGTVAAARHDAVVAGLVLAAAALLAAAGLWLERSGLDPHRDDPRRRNGN